MIEDMIIGTIAWWEWAYHGGRRFKTKGAFVRNKKTGKIIVPLTEILSSENNKANPWGDTPSEFCLSTMIFIALRYSGQQYELSARWLHRYCEGSGHHRHQYSTVLKAAGHYVEIR